MEPSDFDPKIAELEAELRRVRDRMEAAAEAYKGALVAYARDWAATEVENAVVNNPEVAKSAGPEGLKRLKDELATLIARLPEHVEQDLNAHWLWPHRKATLYAEHVDQRARRERYLGQPLSQSDAEAVAQFLGHVGDLLAQHGIINAHGKDDKRWATDFIEGGGPGRGTWRHKLRTLDNLPADVIAAFRAYEILEEPLFKTYHALEDQRRQKAQLEAKKLWDQA